jgi:hypothetical protein
MTILFSGLQVVVGGVQAERVLSIPGGLKQAGVPQIIHVEIDSSLFPVGITTISIGISLDGRVSFKTASMTCQGGLHSKETMRYSLGPNDIPTDARVRIDAPLGFSSNMTVEAL